MRILIAGLASFTAVVPSEAHENFLEAGFPGVMRRWSQFVDFPICVCETHTGTNTYREVCNQYSKKTMKKKMTVKRVDTRIYTQASLY